MILFAHHLATSGARNYPTRRVVRPSLNGVICDVFIALSVVSVELSITGQEN